MALESLREVLAVDYKGPRAVFTETHVLKALLAIGESGSLGRWRLGTSTGLGQGEVRTLIKRLKDNGMILIETDGCRLSKKGENEYQKIQSLLSWSARVDATPLKLGDVCWAVIARRAAGNVRFGIEQRDAAIKAGAGGAFTAIFRSGRFTVPGEGADCEGSGPSEPWLTIRKAPIADGDVAVVTGASGEEGAENGALAAFLTLV